MSTRVITRLCGSSEPLYHSIGSAILSSALVIAASLSWDSTIPSTVLYFYAGLWILIESLRQHYRTRTSLSYPLVSLADNYEPRSASLNTDADNVELEKDARHNAWFARNPIVIAGLFLLTIAASNLIVGHDISAERVANWAFGFLTIGLGASLIDQVPSPHDVSSMPRRLINVSGYIGLTALFLGAGFFLAWADIPSLELRAAYAAAANYLRTNARPGDVILTEQLQVNLRCYGLFGQDIVDLRPQENPEKQIALALANRRHAYFIRPYSDNVGHRAESLALALHADLFERVSGKIVVDAYEVLPAKSTETSVLNADYGPLMLMAAEYSTKVFSGFPVGIRIQLRLDEQDGRDYRVKLVLLDDRDRLVGSVTEFLIDRAGVMSSNWRIGDQVQDQFLLPVPLGTPPMVYTLAIGFWSDDNYSGLELRDRQGLAANRLLPLGTIRVLPRRNFDLDPYDTLSQIDFKASAIQFDQGLRLIGYMLESETVQPGDTMNIALRWQASMDNLSDWPIRLRLREDEFVLTEERGRPVGGLYPFSQWTAGEQVIDRHELRLPANARPGTATLEIGVGSSHFLPLGEVAIRSLHRSFVAPQPQCPVRVRFGELAELIGYDLPPIIRPGSNVSVVLYWRAINPASLSSSQKVFVHLVASDGSIVSQDDTIPAQWERPTTSWIAGEYVIDMHTLQFPTEITSDLSLIVGLYDAVTLQRVPLAHTQGEEAWRTPVELTGAMVTYGLCHR